MKRLVAYLVGGALVAYGCWVLLSTRSVTALWPVVRWLVGAWVAHDLLAVPFALLVGALVVRVLPARMRAPVHAGLFVSAAVVLTAAPFALGHGGESGLPYRQNLLTLLALVWAVVAVFALLRLLSRRGRDGGSGP